MVESFLFLSVTRQPVASLAIAAALSLPMAVDQLADKFSCSEPSQQCFGQVLHVPSLTETCVAADEDFSVAEQASRL